MEGSFREYVVCFDRVKERNEEFSKTVGRVTESFSREVLGCNGEFWRGCNEEYHLGVLGCRFGELPLGVSCGVRIFLSEGRASELSAVLELFLLLSCTVLYC